MTKTKKQSLDLELRRLREDYEVFIVLMPWKTMDHVYEYDIKVFKHAAIQPLVDKSNKGLDIVEELPIMNCNATDYYRVLEYAIDQVKNKLRIL